MKNVAKCDTWCELQNPVNHRVFERKLRPKPFGRGHACLGVTHCASPKARPLASGERLASRAHCRVVGRKASPRLRVSRQALVDTQIVHSVAHQFPDRLRRPLEKFSRPQVRRDYPLSLSISISGGKETNKDSLSNGERTGNSPA